MPATLAVENAGIARCIPTTGEPLVPPCAPSLRAWARVRCFRSRHLKARFERPFGFVGLPPGEARLRRRVRVISESGRGLMTRPDR